MEQTIIELRLNIDETIEYLEKQTGDKMTTVSKILVEETIRLINECHSLATIFQFQENGIVYIGQYPTMLDDILSMLEKANVNITPHMLLVNNCFESNSNVLNKYLNEPRKGDVIEIISMKDEPNYTGKTGTVEHIDDAGQIHGTWGGCALIPGEDTYTIVSKVR